MSEVLLQSGVLPAAAGVFGLLVGAFLNVVIWRVPRGESLLSDSHCIHCDAAIRAWHNVPVISWVLLRGRCRECKAPISARAPIVEVLTAVAFAWVAAWYFATTGMPGPRTLQQLAWWLPIAAYFWFAAVTIALTVIDIEHQRLPDAIVIPSIVVLGVLLGLAPLLLGDWSRFFITLGVGMTMFALYLGVALVYPTGIGGGDVKLAPAIGIVLGSVSLGAAIVGVATGFFFAAVFGLILMLFRRANRKSGIAFGPWMLAGAWYGVIFGDLVFAAYIDTVRLN